jgi:hypothetical protein
MAIIRGPLPQDAYFIAERSWFRDHRLTHKAMGLLGSIASHSADWELTTDQLVRESADGKAAVDTGLRELERVGYLRRIKLRRVQGEDAKRRAGTFAGYDYQLCVPPPEDKPAHAAGVVRAQPNRGVRTRVTTTTRKSATGADQPKRGSTTDRFSSRGQTTGGKSGAKKYKGLEDQEEKTPLPPAADPPPAASVPEQRTGGEDDQSTVYGPPVSVAEQGARVTALVDEVHAARRWSRAAIRRVVQEIVDEGTRPWWAVAAVMTRVAADPLSRGPARLRAVPDDWWPDAAPPRTRLRDWCGGCVERTRQVEVGEDFQPRPCPVCSPQVAGMVAA